MTTAGHQAGSAIEGPAKGNLLVLASTYPRWRGDPEPGFVHELCKRLTAAFEVTVVVPHAAGAARIEQMDGVNVRRFRYAPEFAETLVNDGGIVANLKRDRWKWLLLPGFFLASLLATIRALRGSSISIIHAHWLIPQGLVAAVASMTVRAGCPPFVVTSHGADLFALRSPLFAVLKRFVIRRAATVSVVSRAMVPAMNALSAKAPLVCSMGVDLDNRFVPSAEDLRSENELLFVGRLVEKKGLRHLISALPLIIRSKPDAVLCVAGFGPEELQLRQQIEALGLQDRVTFLGAVSQEALPTLYRRAAVMVAPFVQAGDGDQEGLGLVAVEAIGCGCPVVLGNVAAASEVQSMAPDMVELTSVQPEALASAVIRQMDLRSRSASLAALKSRFGWNAVAETYAHWLTQAANGPAKVAKEPGRG